MQVGSALIFERDKGFLIEGVIGPLFAYIRDNSLFKDRKIKGTRASFQVSCPGVIEIVQCILFVIIDKSHFSQI
ncbi:hypothetical protein Javan268_0042 [Streptococcus phage Javan268]|nr:hypothetical protein Javan268_0042 [Streptococcus phage Javan268]